jgi:hypothetical protein
MKKSNITKEQMLAAQSKTRSNRAAARYLNVSYPTYRKWAKLYIDQKTGQNLFELHKNQSGNGIPKFLRNKKKDPALIDIIEGRVDPSSFSPQKLKNRLIKEGYLKENCYYCGFHEKRVSDNKTPLILSFKDRNKKNYRKENIEMVCYNCHYLYIGDVFNDKQMRGLEDHLHVNESNIKKIEDHTPLLEEKPEWNLDPYQIERLKELGLMSDVDNSDYDIVSKI